MLNVIFQLTQYDGQVTQNDPVDSIQVSNSIQQKTITDINRLKIVIPNATSNQSISLSSSSTNYLAISTDQTITVVINGSNTPLTLSPLVAGTKTLAFYQKGTVASLTISNSSGSIANIDLISIT